MVAIAQYNYIVPVIYFNFRQHNLTSPCFFCEFEKTIVEEVQKEGYEQEVNQVGQSSISCYIVLKHRCVSTMVM